MNRIQCNSCGASDWLQQNDVRICRYCGAKYQLTSEEIRPLTSNISISSDIQNLLQKCEDEPANARKYANLVLDIDPNNIKALKYL